jgi:single-stranded-DNA-specific exonuclease
VVQDRVVAEAMAMLGERDPGPAIVLAGEGWPAGVVGIVAAKLVDKFQRPAFVVGIDPATGIGRGSARTIGGVNLYDALAAAAPHLDRFGGHAAAAGFTVRRELVAAMSETIAAAVGAASQLAEGSGPVARVTIGGDGAADAEVRLTDVDERLAEELAGLGPFGQDNREPTLVTRNARVTAVRRVGADDAHLKLTVTDDAGNTRTCIGFGLGPRDCHTGDRVDLAFLPTISTWQGRRSAELTLRDFTILA